MTGGWITVALTTIFWVVTGVELLMLLSHVWRMIYHADGEFAGLGAIYYFVFACGLAAIMLVFFFLHDMGFRVLLLVVAIAPLPSVVIKSVHNLMTAPSAEDMDPSGNGRVAGHVYFKSPADRALADAVVARDAGKVAELAPGANINAIGSGGMTFMELAMGHYSDPDPAVVVALLKAGANPDQGDQILFGYATKPDQRWRGMFAAGGDGVPLLHTVIDAGVDLNQRNQEGVPRFFSGLKLADGLALMLEHGANIEAEDKDGNTALTWAVRLSCWRAIDVLLAHGARVDHAAHDGQGLRDLVRETLESYHSDKIDPPAQLTALGARLP